MIIYDNLIKLVKQSTVVRHSIKTIVGSAVVVSTLIVTGHADAATPLLSSQSAAGEAEPFQIQATGVYKPVSHKIKRKRSHNAHFGFKGHRSYGKRYGYGKKYYGHGFKNHYFHNGKYFVLKPGVKHKFGHGIGHRSKKFVGKGHRRGFRGNSHRFGIRGRRG